mgnify:CR=1 FL=1
MDFLTAKHLYEHMYPKPLEIICYHCQQSIEKLLKGLLISKNVTIKKTHDLDLLAELLQEYETVDEKYHVTKALQETELLYDWLTGILESQNRQEKNR